MSKTIVGSCAREGCDRKSVKKSSKRIFVGTQRYVQLKIEWANETVLKADFCSEECLTLFLLSFVDPKNNRLWRRFS